MNYRILRSLFVGIAACVFAQNSVSVKDCSPSDALFQVDKLSFEPSVPVPGQNGTLFTTYTVPTPVDGGKTRYSCTLNGLPVYDEQFDLCTQTTCPITIGQHTDTSTSAVPSTSGKIDCLISWYDSSNKPLMCIEMIFKLQ
jgi:hypothetical protein